MRRTGGDDPPHPRPHPRRHTAKRVSGGVRSPGALDQHAVDHGGHELLPLIFASEDVVLIEERLGLGSIAALGGEDCIDPLAMNRE